MIDCTNRCMELVAVSLLLLICYGNLDQFYQQVLGACCLYGQIELRRSTPSDMWSLQVDHRVTGTRQNYIRPSTNSCRRMLGNYITMC